MNKNYRKTGRIIAILILTVFLSNEKSPAAYLRINDSITAENIAEKLNLIEHFAVDEDEIFTLVNEKRQRNNLNILKCDEQLSQIARNYSEQMARENFFDHFDAQGRDVVARAENSHLKHWSKIGENLFSIEGMRNFDAFAVENWIKSPTHRQNILDADFNTTGIGIAKSRSGEIFVTQVFIKR